MKASTDLEIRKLLVDQGKVPFFYGFFFLLLLFITYARCWKTGCQEHQIRYMHTYTLRCEKPISRENK